MQETAARGRFSRHLVHVCVNDGIGQCPHLGGLHGTDPVILVQRPSQILLHDVMEEHARTEIVQLGVCAFAQTEQVRAVIAVRTAGIGGKLALGEPRTVA